MINDDDSVLVNLKFTFDWNDLREKIEFILRRILKLINYDQF